MNYRVSQRTNTNVRINFLMFGFFIACLVFIVRLFSIQVFGHEEYKSMAELQHWALQEIPAKRGEILSADGFPLATNQLSYLLYVEPQKIEDPYQTSYDVARVIFEARNLDIQKEVQEFNTLRDELHQSMLLDLIWVASHHNLTLYEKERLEKANIEGIGFEEEPIRYYPEGKLAAHVLGFVGRNEEGGEQGYFGVEGSYDGDLKGRHGRIVQEKDATGAPILVGGYKRVPPTNGRSVVLTINRAVQYLIERHLEDGVRKYGAVSGSVIVMDPENGDVIAMANFPTYDPRSYFENDGDSQDQNTGEVANGVESTSSVANSKVSYSFERRNLAIAETYEPGSVMKAVTVSAATDLGKVTPQSTFEDNGPVTYSDYVIDNWDGKHYGVQTVVQLLQKSNNIGAAWVGHLVGTENLHDYLTDFGFGRNPGIGLEGEDTGIIRNVDDWTDIDLANISFGQGISATPLQVLNAFNVIANGGNFMRPRVVSKIIDETKIIDIPPEAVRKVLSRDTSEVVTDMLVQAVAGGEAKYFANKNYAIAGKTGTAQIPFEGKYDPEKTNATFVGYLAKSKKFSMIVRLDRPSSSIYAAETAVPLWMDITEDLVKYYGIPPDVVSE